MKWGWEKSISHVWVGKRPWGEDSVLHTLLSICVNRLKPVPAEATLRMWLFTHKEQGDIWAFSAVGLSVIISNPLAIPITVSLWFFSWLLLSFASVFSLASFPECKVSQPFFHHPPLFLHLALWSTIFNISIICTSVSICSWDVAVTPSLENWDLPWSPLKLLQAHLLLYLE